MKIGLIDVDGHHFPNLALMKISAWHKAAGDSVEWCNHFERYDIVCKSKVFTFTPDEKTAINATVVCQGGTGYRDYVKTLPESEEHITPDYWLYGIDYAVGFTTRGCVNNCPWCVVPKKEGAIRPASPLREFLGGKRNYSKEDVADFVMRMTGLIADFDAAVYWKKSVSDYVRKEA